jgi:hypothetical protein
VGGGSTNRNLFFGHLRQAAFDEARARVRREYLSLHGFLPGSSIPLPSPAMETEMRREGDDHLHVSPYTDDIMIACEPPIPPLVPDRVESTARLLITAPPVPVPDRGTNSDPPTSASVPNQLVCTEPRRSPARDEPSSERPEPYTGTLRSWERQEYRGPKNELPPWGDLTPSHEGHPGVEIEWRVDLYGLTNYSLDAGVYGAEARYHCTGRGVAFEVYDYCREEMQPKALGVCMVGEVMERDDLYIWSDHHRLAAEIRRGEMMMGKDPVIILIPMRFRMRQKHRPGSSYLRGTLLDTQPCAWRAQREGDHMPMWYTWAWLWYWKRQLRFWTLQQMNYPQLVALGSDGAVGVNAFLYRKLADHYSDIWRFNGQMLGGYLAPGHPRVCNASWDYAPSQKPRVNAPRG